MTNSLLLLRDELVSVHWGQTDFPYWGTNWLTLFGDKLVALIEGQTDCPYWGTNRLPLLRDKLIVLIGGQTGCPYWGTNWLYLLRDKLIVLIEGQTDCPYWMTNRTLPIWLWLWSIVKFLTVLTHPCLIRFKPKCMDIVPFMLKLAIPNDMMKCVLQCIGQNIFFYK